MLGLRIEFGGMMKLIGASTPELSGMSEPMSVRSE